MIGCISTYHMVMNIIMLTLRLYVHKCLKNTEDTHKQSLTIIWYLTRKCADVSYNPDQEHISDEH